MYKKMEKNSIGPREKNNSNFELLFGVSSFFQYEKYLVRNIENKINKKTSTYQAQDSKFTSYSPRVVG